MTSSFNHSPLVSAIVSTYNAERFMRGKLEDLEAQTVASELEIVVVDSGSQQNERAIVEEFQRRYGNIRYIRTERRETVYQAWNRGIKAARGEFVTNANTDDRLRPDCYEKLVQALRERPECVLAYPDMRITLQENATFESHQPHGFRDWPEFDRIFLMEVCCVGPFPLWRRSLHDEIGFFDERYRSAADYEFWLRAALVHDFVHVPQFLGLYWLSQETVSRKGELPTLEYLQVQKEYRPKYAPLTPPPVALSPHEEEVYRALVAAHPEGSAGAIQELERFAELHPRCPGVHHDLADLYYRKGETGYAKTHFEKAALIDPASDLQRDRLQAFLRSELAQARQFYVSEAAAAPDDLETQLCLGMICILLDRSEAAAGHYRRALQLAPDCAPARENLARLERRGEAASAEEVSRYHGFARPEVRRLVSRGSRKVLDVGCAAGRLASAIKRRQGATVWGIEPHREAAAEAAKLLDRVIGAPVEEALRDLPERHFDTVILADVLEHLTDPEAVLAALERKLAPCGELVVSLPNVRHWSVIQGLLEGSWDYSEAGIMDRTHLRFFTRESAVRCFERAGYAVTAVTPVALADDAGIPDRMLRALRQGGVQSPTLEEESRAYQYLFRLVRKDDLLTSIVMLTFNELDCTKECLESIERNTPEPHEVILVDNGSTDGTVQWLREFCAGKDGYVLIENGRNLGFAAGCNIGMERARGGRILLLNNDVVVTRGWLNGMLDALEREGGAAIVGPMTNQIAGPQRVAGTCYRSIDELETYAADFRVANSKRRITVDRVVGFAMLFTRRLMDEAGFLDTRFGSGNFEDDDFCLRAGLAGYRSLIAGDVFIHHYGSRSFTGNGIDYAAAMSRNRSKFDEKWRLTELDETLARKVVTHNAVVQGRRLAWQGRLNEAVDLLLQQAIACSPEAPEPYLVLARLLADAGKFRESLDLLTGIPKGEEMDTTLLRGLSLAGLGKHAQALEHAEEALRLDPESPAALWLKGTVVGRPEEAEELHRKAMLADPGFGPAYTAMAEIFWNRDEREKGLHLAETGFVLSPLSMSALDRFHSYATACSALPREELRVREALALYPEHKGLSYGLIELLIRRGSFAGAMDEIERASVRFGLDDATIDAALEIRGYAGAPAPAGRGNGSVSLCMIVKNEARHLAGALLSVKGFADEVIVVDTGSTDRTSDIARIFGARVFSFPWNGSFSDARNYSLSKAQGDWILVLDADEVLAPRELPPLKSLLQGCETPTAYSFTTRNYTGEVSVRNWNANDGRYPGEQRGRGWVPSDKVRLFPNDCRVRFQGAVHELIEPSLLECGITIHACDVPVHHYGKLDAARCAEKRVHYYQLGMKKLAESGGSTEAVIELARQATELGRLEEAEGLWLRVLKARPEEAEAYFNLGYLYLATGDYLKGRRHALRGAELAPEMKEALFNLGKCELFLGMTAEALGRCEKMLEKWPEYPPALSLLAATLLASGRTGEGEAVVEKVRRMGFDCHDFLTEFAAGLKKAARHDLAAHLLESAEREVGPAGGGSADIYCHAV